MPAISTTVSVSDIVQIFLLLGGGMALFLSIRDKFIAMGTRLAELEGDNKNFQQRIESLIRLEERVIAIERFRRRSQSNDADV